MTWRGTLMLLLAALLAAAVLVLQSRTRTRGADEPLLGIKPAEVTSVAIRSGDEETVLEKQDGAWRIIRPLADRADQAAVARLLGSATSLTSLDRLQPSDLKDPVSLTSLDLQPAKRIVTFRDGKSHTLQFGAEGPAQGQVYARIDADPSVYLVPSETASLAFLPVADLRDPRPLPVRQDHLAGIRLSRRGGTQEMTLAKTGVDWVLETPLRSRADRQAVQSWIADILGAKILRWMPGETTASSCGLDSPEAVLTLCEDGGDPSVLEIGAEVPGTPGARFARCPDRPGIFVMGNATRLTGITPASLRLRHPAPVRLDCVDRITIGTRSLSRKPGGADWICGETTVAAPTLDAWFAKFQGLTASSFEPATPERLAQRGIDPASPKIRMVAHLSENTAEESAGEMILAEYAVGSASGGETALREGDSADLMILPSDGIAALLEEAEGWSAQQPTPSPAASPVAR